ncbi:MAG: hypothetical protein R2787_04595 [Saprospiraceae bacterium]
MTKPMQFRTFNPNFGKDTLVTAELLQAPEVCGNPALIEVKLWSQQANPVSGLFEDMLLTFNACDSAGMVVNQIRVGPEGNEMALPFRYHLYQGSRGSRSTCGSGFNLMDPEGLSIVMAMDTAMI